MVETNLKMRENNTMNLATVKQALLKATRVVFVCDAQRQLYEPSGPSKVIFVGVPAPPLNYKADRTIASRKIFTFLCIGIVCPRKNQVWAVELFKAFAKDRTDVKLVIVGARETRQYEIDYLNLLKVAIGNDSRIELHPVTENVDPFYQAADVLLFTSTNEVTPMVISEAMSYEIPVITTNIGMIPTHIIKLVLY